MKTTIFKISANVWLYPGEAAWYFVTIEKDDAEEIKQEYIWPKRGFGAIPVMVKINKTEWKTSIFPEKIGTYLLPIKKSVRVSEEIKEGDKITFTLRVLN